MGFNLSEFLFGSPAEVKTKTIEDPTKTAVSGPLSQYLSSRIGQGLPKYSEELTTPLDPGAVSSFKDFLALDAGEFFQEKVAAPATRRFKEDLLPVVREGFAGNLRGSGRIGTEFGLTEDLSVRLADMQGKFELELPKAQFELASARKAQLDHDVQVRYKAWLQTLPEFNPVINQAMQFLGVPSGFDTATFLDPGSEGSYADILKMAAGTASSSFSGSSGGSGGSVSGGIGTGGSFSGGVSN